MSDLSLFLRVAMLVSCFFVGFYGIRLLAEYHSKRARKEWLERHAKALLVAGKKK